jgi:hypothetical protein
MSEVRHEDAPITMQHRINLLRRVCAVLNEHDINYFLTCGTLLGYIRDNDFIRWDTDIDIGVFDMNEVLKLEKQFGKKGLRCELYYHGHGSPKLTIRDNDLDVDCAFHVDLFEFEATKDGFVFKFGFLNQWYIDLIRKVLLSVLRIVKRPIGPSSLGVIEGLEASSMPLAWKQRIRPLHHWFKMKMYKEGVHIFEPFTCVEVPWFGLFVKIPSRPIDHLRLLYGDDWYIPKPNYSKSKERQRNVRRVRL